MNKKYFTALAVYNNWTDNVAIDWLNQINDEQWNQVIIGSFNSIKKTAIHIASAEKIWIDFWQTFSHIINHSTYHRGQLVTLLRQAGF